MEKARILIVDDEQGVRFVIERALAYENYSVETAANGREAIEKLRTNHYDVILLDLQMEPVNGMEVMKAQRENDQDTQIIVLTAHGSIETAIEALRMSVFDYLLKPATNEAIRIRVKEALAHRQDLLRRSRLANQVDALRQTLQEITDGTDNPAATDSINERFIHAGQLIIDQHHQAATFQGRLLELTTTEFNILTHLAKSSPQPLAARQLVNLAMGYAVEDSEASEILKYHIHHLRQKIEPVPEKPAFIKTVRYKGYLWSG